MSSPKLKILWSSVNPTVESGYGRVTNAVGSRLVKKGYDIMFHGYQTTGRLNTVDDTFKMLECGGMDYGFNVFPMYFQKYHRDILITLYDIWAFFGRAERFEYPWIPYFPIDAEPVTAPISNPLKYAYKRICFSKFAEKELDKVKLNSTIIYHGVDTKVFKPFTKKEKLEIRNKTKIPENAFLVGTNGANTWDRKDFPRMIRIFSDFVKKYNAKDALLYLHSNPDGIEGKAFNFVELGRLYGIENQLRIAHQKNQLEDTGLAKMYNSFDVYFSTSRAEGCGLPILEAQACGIPCIVPDNSAQPEWVKGHGWVVPCSDHVVVLTTPLHNRWYLIDVEKAVDALEEAYTNKKLRKKYSLMSRKAMLQYDWDKVVDEQWIPFLQNVEEELYGERRKTWVDGKTFTIRNKKIDNWVVNEVVRDKTYAKFLSLQKEDVWLDIGGHIGTFSIDIADKVKQVYAFEPEKENFELFNENVLQNNVKNVLVFNKAVVGNDDKERTFYLDNCGNTGGNSLIGALNFKETKVQCENIEEIIKKYSPDKIKLDCEGAEYEILLNADLRKIKEIVMEYHFNLLGLAKYEEMVDYLRKIGFDLTLPQVFNPKGQCIIYCRRSEKSSGANK